jgi:hypothetical protein
VATAAFIAVRQTGRNSHFHPTGLLPRPPPPPAGLAHTLTRSAPLEPSQPSPAACWLLPQRPRSSEQEASLPRSRVGTTCRVSRHMEQTLA